MAVRDSTSYAITVTIGGVAYDPAQIVCDVVIRSGRARQDDGLNPASCTVELLEAAAGGIMIEIASPLVVSVDGSARFTGRVSEVTRTPTPTGGTWTVIGMGHIRRLATLLMTVPIPSESAAARATRVINALGVAADVRGGAGYTMAAYGQSGDAPASANAVMGGVIDATGAVVQDKGNGGILVQFEDARLSEDKFVPDPAVTATDLAFAQNDDVVNDIRVAWAGGAATAQDPASITKYDRHAVSIDTQLNDGASAQTRAGSIVARLAYPAWSIDSVSTWDRTFFAHEIGALVELAPLPPGSPVEEPWTGVMEGYVEHYQPSTDGSGRVVGVFTIAVADRAHSAESIHWGGVTPSLTWAGVDPATSWAEAISNAALTP